MIHEPSDDAATSDMKDEVKAVDDAEAEDVTVLPGVHSARIHNHALENRIRRKLDFTIL